MAGASQHTREQIELHRTVAHMYRRREAWTFAREFQDERNAILMSLAPPGPAGAGASAGASAGAKAGAGTGVETGTRAPRAVDLGCATGIMLDRLVGRYGSAVGLDASQEMLDGFPPEARGQVKLVRADMAALPFAGGSFDVVVCRSALHHMDDEVGVLSEIARVLTPAGSLVLGEPANDNLVTRLARWWLRRRPSFGKLHTIDRAYTRGQLRELLARAGLTVRREVRFGFVAYPLCDNPELVPVLKWLPFNTALGRALRALDRLLARVPLMRSQSWYVMLEVGRLR